MKIQAMKKYRSSKNIKLLEAIKEFYELRGIIYLIKYSLLTVTSNMLSPIWNQYNQIKYKTNKLSQNTFLFKNKKYNYFRHTYNRTGKNERAIEIPIIKNYLDKRKGKNVLEIGNVLSHYYKVKHEIIDRFEVGFGVTNIDIINYKPKKKYQIIFSISTFEHIGLDEPEKDKNKALRAINSLIKYLDKDGIIVFTIPLGYNLILDGQLMSGEVQLDQMYFLKKVSLDNKWIEINKKEAYNSYYGFPFLWGNTILLGIIKNHDSSITNK